MEKRASCKRVKARALNMHNQKLYERYAQTFEAANELGRRLKEAASLEWNNKYPNGIDGQICIFNATAGALTYVMKDMAKLEETAKKAFDADRGDDVFSHPSAGLTSDTTDVNAGIDGPDTLAIIGESLRHAIGDCAENEQPESAGPLRSAGPSFGQRLRGKG